jgi:hypothetical protein
MVRSIRRLAFVLLAALSSRASAEEGMWTFDNLPVQQLHDKYNFTPTQGWLDHLRLSSVRLGDGGSGSFVSAHGLLLTNHHVALHQLQNNSMAEHDYVRDGFYAATPDAEIKSPDLEVNVLQSMQDVTARVNAAVKPEMSPKEGLDARHAAIAAIESESDNATHLKSEVVTLYEGGEYWLYRYKKYTDVRLVFAPELQAAFFGGDSDNFTFPRYCLDMAVFRVYEDGKPIDTPNHLTWNVHGAAANELVFVSGHPGSLSRDVTMSELVLERDLYDPIFNEALDESLSVLQAYAARGPDQKRNVASSIFGLQNSIKARSGRYGGLLDTKLMGKKQAEETEFRSRVDQNPQWKKDFGNAWQEVEQANQATVGHGTAFFYRYSSSDLLGKASRIVQYTAEIKKPDGERLPGYHDAELESMMFRLLSPAPVHPDLEIAKMTGSLSFAQKKLPADDPWLAIVLDGKTPAAAADFYVAGTKMADPAFRKQLIDGGIDAVNASTDPMIVLARKLDPMARAEHKWQEENIEGRMTHAHEQIAKARFLSYGKTAYPDATFTLRLSYGTVAGFPMNGTVAPPMTTLFGLYDKNASFGDNSDWKLAPRWKQGRDKLDLSTPMDFVTTNDIIGGNSGSPVVNRAGELVGLVFDGNIDSLPGEYEYDPRANRTVAVHPAVMIEALRKLYDASKLADELLAG